MWTMRPISRLFRLSQATQQYRTLFTRNHIISASPCHRPVRDPCSNLAAPCSQIVRFVRPLHSTASRALEGTDASVPTSSSSSSPEQTPERPPSYELSFTCKPCRSRSTHVITKQGYHNGAVLITCPTCKNRHVISDHLGIFADEKFTIEDLMRQKGELVKRGRLGEDGDLEFWDDGSTTEREKSRGNSQEAQDKETAT